MSKTYPFLSVMDNTCHLVDNSYYYYCMWSLWKQWKNYCGEICNELSICMMLSKVSFQIFKAMFSFGQFDYLDKAIITRRSIEIWTFK